METHLPAEIVHIISLPSISASVLIVLLCLYLFQNAFVFYKGFPVMGMKGKLSYSKARRAYKHSAQAILADAHKQTGGPFQVMTQGGVQIVLPSRYMKEIESDKRLSSNDALRRNFMADIPGFEGFHAATHENILQRTIRIKVTQNLDSITKDLLDETRLSAEDFFGTPSEWQEVKPFDPMYMVIIRVSSRVFMDEKLGRDEEWLRIARTYATMSFDSAQSLRAWPEFVRPYVHWFLSDCQKLRALVRDTRRVIGPEVERVAKEYMADLKAGRKGQENKSATTMFIDVAKGRKFDLVEGQLSIASAALHTTTDLIIQILYNLCAHPEYFAPLREEITSVIQEHGWQKRTFQQLKFMDSLMKETQRLKPIGQTAVQRVPMVDVKLSDGTVLPKGSHVVVYNDGSRDPQIFEDPERFDPYRFLRMRSEPGKENSNQFASTSPSQLGFGHGIHACPGRFFVSNEVKIILSHMVMKYDWKFANGQDFPEPIAVGSDFVTNPEGRLMYRLRENPIYRA